MTISPPKRDYAAELGSLGYPKFSYLKGTMTPPVRSGADELVERNGIGETADAVWKALNTEHQKLFPTHSAANGDTSVTNLEDAPIKKPTRSDVPR